MLRLAGWIAALLIGTAAGHAAPIAAYTGLAFLGDSLTDTGNEYARTKGKRLPDPPYYKGRASNGRVWADYFSQPFVDLGKPVINKAYAGAEAANDPGGIPDIPVQVDLLLAKRSVLGKRPLIAVLGGGNDIINEVDDLTPIFSLESRTKEAGKAAARAMLDSFERLVEAGANDFIAFMLPDLADLPAFTAVPVVRDIVRDASRLFNKRLRDGLAKLREDGVKVTIVRLDLLLDEIHENPASFGVKHTKVPCIVPGVRVCDKPGNYAFYDLLHATTEIHEAIAAAVSAKGFLNASSASSLAAPSLAPVPLPAGSLLLISGIGLLALTRRRHLRGN